MDRVEIINRAGGITETFSDRYPNISTFIEKLTPYLDVTEDGEIMLDYGIIMTAADWKIIYQCLYRKHAMKWFAYDMESLRDINVADKILHEYPRIKFERAVEQRLVTSNDITTLLTDIITTRSANSPATAPEVEDWNYTNMKTKNENQQSIAAVINTAYINRSRRLEMWCDEFEDLFTQFDNMYTGFITISGGTNG